MKSPRDLWTRRRVLGTAGVLAGAAAAGVWRAAHAGPDGHAEPDNHAGERGAARRIALQNLHTSESVDLVFRRGGTCEPDALRAIQVLLRDHRTGDQHPIDPRLLDDLSEVARLAGVDPVFRVISGYRSPRTNELLRERSGGVASHSLHMEGRAIDVRLDGIDCAALASTGLGMRRGGVGYYRRSDFVHLDTGQFRTWRG